MPAVQSTLGADMPVCAALRKRSSASSLAKAALAVARMSSHFSVSASWSSWPSRNGTGMPSRNLSRAPSPVVEAALPSNLWRAENPERSTR
eukprot:14753557-Alexandrium_andersonii.AAC.1